MSPNEAGLPSLPELDKSMAVRLNESVNTGAFELVALIRGPAAEPQADAVGVLLTGVVDDKEGNATSESVSKVAGAWALAFAGEAVTSDGNGSGAPSSSCLLCRLDQSMNFNSRQNKPANQLRKVPLRLKKTVSENEKP